MFLRVEIVKDWQDIGFDFKIGEILVVELLEGAFYAFRDYYLIAKSHCKII